MYHMVLSVDHSLHTLSWKEWKNIKFCRKLLQTCKCVESSAIAEFLSVTVEYTAVRLLNESG